MDYGFLNVLELIGSLGVFIFGMKIMSEAIQKIAGKGLRLLLKKLTDNRFAGWVTGFVTTVLIQSSSATTVMVVSFVNAGLLTVAQSIGVIMGANLGTTATSWLIALFGFSKFKITAYALPTIAIGFPLIFSGNNKRKSLGEFLLGFGLLFIGLEFMKNSVPDLQNNPQVLSFLANFSGHGFLSIILFVFIGTLVTIIVQSSSAAMSITLVMVAQGWVPIEVGACMVLGENIGTTITAYLAALIGNVEAKRAARAHMIFNIIGVVWMIILLNPFVRWVDSMNMSFFGFESVLTGDITERGEAMPKALSLFHSLFNLLNGILLIGFVKTIERVVVWMVPDKTTEVVLRKLGKNQIVETPELAILEAKNELLKMAALSEEMLIILKNMLLDQNHELQSQLTELEKKETQADELELSVSSFLIDVAQYTSGSETSTNIIKLIEASDELESITDICYDSGKIVFRKNELDLIFSPKMLTGINEMIEEIDQALKKMKSNLDKELDEIDFEGAEKHELQINALRDELKLGNMKRLERKEEKLQSAIYYRDLYSALEKMGDKIFQVSKVLASK